MGNDGTPPADAEASASAAAAGRPRRAVMLGLGAVLVAATYVAGSASLDAPWMQGDEYIFIADNPDVTGAGRAAPLWRRCLQIFGHVHEDLYQPIPILTYALEWSLWGDQRVFFIRQTDVLLHALNGLLLWAVLRRLLARLQTPGGRAHNLLAWALALLWTLHPALVIAYAADMGRTHVLSATFALLSLLLHLRAVATGRWPPFVAAVAALLLAMLCKPVVGWVGLILALEWALLGLRATLRTPRIYVVAAVCAAFALLTLRTSAQAGLIADSQLALFGDPAARSFLAVWLYLRNVVAPLGQLSTWYLPDIHTSWSYPLVWVGVLLSVAGLAAAGWSARRPATRGIAVGIVWFAALLLPVIGVVGGRVAAAQDRYLYQPLMGLVLVLGVLAGHWLDRRDPRAARRRLGVLVGLTAAACLAMLIHDTGLCYDARSTLRRAQRVVALNPGDPRAMEMLAVAYDFARLHDVPERGGSDTGGLDTRFRARLYQAAELAEANPQYFRDEHDRAAFHRRLSFALLRAQDAAQSLKQALRARDFEPEAAMTWTRLGHAYRALQDWDAALAAYEKLESVLPADPSVRALRYTEFGDLLLYQFKRPDRAGEKYRLAVETGLAPVRAAVGWARCEVRAGEGIEGFRIISAVLRAHPDNLDALLVLGEYHLRSNHWDEAGRVYSAITSRHPTDYEALRGLHEVCVQTARYRDAALAWDAAVRRAPRFLPFQAYLVWSAMLAGDDAAPQMAEALLARAPNNRYACLARMLHALRAGQLDQALAWVAAARKGPALPEARELARAAETLRVMRARQELPAEAVVAEAALRAARGERVRAAALLEDYLEKGPASAWRERVEQLRVELNGGRDGP